MAQLLAPVALALDADTMYDLGKPGAHDPAHGSACCASPWSHQPMNLKSDDDDHNEPVLELVPGQRQLFVDELHVRTKWGVVTEFHRAQKKGAVIRDYGFGNMTGSVQTRRYLSFISTTLKGSSTSRWR